MLQTILSERRTYSEVGCSHVHAYAQLILPLTGTLQIETQVHQMSLDESSVFFLPPQCPHYFSASKRNEFLVLDIPAHLVAQLAGGDVAHGVRVDLEERWQAMRLLLLAELRYQSLESGNLLHLVNYLATLLTLPHPSRSLTYIHQHFCGSLNVAHLAQIEGYSLAYYCEWFKAKTGKSPKAYIQDLRLQHAKKLLQQTNLPIYAIAEQVGFQQTSSLTRLFQQQAGMSPQRFRSMTQNSAN